MRATAVRKGTFLFIFQMGIIPLGATFSFAASWCDHFQAGESVRQKRSQALAGAHAEVKFFSAQEKLSSADQALAAMLESQSPLSKHLDLKNYAEALIDVCSKRSSVLATRFARLRVHGDVLIVSPGVGTIEIPPTAKAAILDLRGLNNNIAVEQSLKLIVSQLIAHDLELPIQTVRQNFGLNDITFPDSIYQNRKVALPAESIVAMRQTYIPIVVITDAVMPPFAVKIAEALKIKARAWLIGEPLFTSVAEARWIAIGNQGIAYRNSELSYDGIMIPDQILPDYSISKLEEAIQNLIHWGPSPAISVAGISTRAKIDPFQVEGDLQPMRYPRGDIRAAVISAYGAAQLFFPYFRDRKRMIDRAFQKSLVAADHVDATDRRAERNLLRQMSHAFSDGHSSVVDLSVPVPGLGVFPVKFIEIDGKIFISKTNVPGTHPGDQVISLNGIKIKKWFRTEMKYSSAATSQYRFLVAGREIWNMNESGKIEIIDQAGRRQMILVTPQPVGSLMDIIQSGSPSHWLTEYGAPHVFYLNMDRAFLANAEQGRALLETAKDASGLIVDMRGYPNGTDYYEIAQRLVCKSIAGPSYFYPVLNGTSAISFQRLSRPLEALTNPSYCGPIALLVGSGSVSAAETFSQLLLTSERVKVFGRSSAGTTGDETGLSLPGFFKFTFTGAKVLNSDGSEIQGVGIIPDKEVKVSVDDIRSNRDTELEQALTHFNWLPKLLQTGKDNSLIN